LAERVRVDRLAVERGLYASREQAARAILAGDLRVDGVPCHKAGTMLTREARLERVATEAAPVSRGAYKLKKALSCFPVEVEGRVVIDVGASTGGFTQVLLDHGAARVHSVDVGYGQLAWALRQDPRVRVLERTNIRHLTRETLLAGDEPEPTLAVVDVSFIGLAKILPALVALVAPGSPLITLVKPQFEAGPKDVGKGGVVRDPAVHGRVLREVTEAFEAHGYRLHGLEPSPIRGPEGNLEFVAWWQPGEPARVVDPAEVVRRAHAEVPLPRAGQGDGAGDGA
jgi:23S rRNA (cytidine1920-2'-O)/16S rRNA (cytidine1409-2'-O)-methyltransferase